MGSPYDQLSDPKLMATIMWLESRVEGEEGMRAVGHVLKNRVGFPGFPQTLRAVIFQKNAFSCLIPSNPEYGKLPQAGDPQFAFCQLIVPQILNGSDTDLTKGAHYYENAKTATSGWFARVIVADTVHHPLLVTIGEQNFYL